MTGNGKALAHSLCIHGDRDSSDQGGPTCFLAIKLPNGGGTEREKQGFWEKVFEKGRRGTVCHCGGGREENRLRRFQRLKVADACDGWSLSLRRRFAMPGRSKDSEKEELIAATEALLRAARAGSDSALGKALELYRPNLTRMARNGGGGELGAKAGLSDLVHETFLAAVKYFPRFRGSSIEEFNAWLEKILRTRIATLKRRYLGTRKRAIQQEVPLRRAGSSLRQGAQPLAKVPSPSQKAMQNESKRLLHEALARLPADYRRVIQLRKVEEHSFFEIGGIMGRSEDAARMLYARAVERLRAEMEPTDGP